MKEQTEYDKQAADFCAATGLTIKKQYTGHRPYFAGEKDHRAIWSITFERPNRRPYTFTFGASMKDSWRAYDSRGVYSSAILYGTIIYKDATQEGVNKEAGGITITKIHLEPSDYDVLACIQKRGNLSFQDFCDNYGYNSDSIKDRDIWIACNEQAAAIESMFSQKEIEQLEEIQ